MDLFPLFPLDVLTVTCSRLSLLLKLFPLVLVTLLALNACAPPPQKVAPAPTQEANLQTPEPTATAEEKGTTKLLEEEAAPVPVPPPALEATAEAEVAVSETTEEEATYSYGEDPEFARTCGWPVASPAPLPGSVLPEKRVVAFYGNPMSTRMGILGEKPKKEMLLRLQQEVERWQLADPATPVQPALHLIAVVAQNEPGKVGLYRKIMLDSLVEEVYGWAKEAGALLFIDIQAGHDDVRDLVPRFEWILKNPDVHLGIDPEFNLLGESAVPGTKFGVLSAAEINDVSTYLTELVEKYQIPPKMLTVHRFTEEGVKGADRIALRPEVQVIINMDGWGEPALKRYAYMTCIVSEPVQFPGFKIFYRNDTLNGSSLMSPEDILRLTPTPLYIQYQ